MSKVMLLTNQNYRALDKRKRLRHHSSQPFLMMTTGIVSVNLIFQLQYALARKSVSSDDVLHCFAGLQIKYTDVATPFTKSNIVSK